MAAPARGRFGWVSGLAVGIVLTCTVSACQVVHVEHRHAAVGTPTQPKSPMQSVVPGQALTPRLSAHKSSPLRKVTSSPAGQKVIISVPTSALEKLWIPATGQLLDVQGVTLGNPIDPPFNPATIDRLVYYDNSGNLGGNPGSHADRATYIACHTWHGPGGHSACNVLDRRITVGDDVYALTAASKRLGVWLHYRVSARPVFGSLLSARARPTWLMTSRLVFITCHLRGDLPQQGRRVIFAEPTGVTPINE